MNAFYASVELLSHPELTEKPVAVCGDPKARHGIILAKNEHAKRYGVVTAETIRQAKQKCPHQRKERITSPQTPNTKAIPR
jgi:DNA polymerase-4